MRHVGHLPRIKAMNVHTAVFLVMVPYNIIKFEDDSEETGASIMRHTSALSCVVLIINCQGSWYQYNLMMVAVGCSEILAHV